MNIVLIGPPGTGKGTQAELLSKKLGIPAISTGEALRNIAKSSSSFGRKVKGMLFHGGLLPDSIVIKVLSKRLKQKDCGRGFILDGFPRNLNQAVKLDRMVHIDFVFYIKSSERIIVKRLSARRQCSKCGKIYGLDVVPKKEGVCDVCGGELYQREDDKPEIIKKRLAVYKKETKPLIEYYKNKKILFEINGEQKISRIFSDIMSHINSSTRHSVDAAKITDCGKA